MDEPLGTIWQQRRTRVATPGSQRRCYDGCWHPDDWEMVWTQWIHFETNVRESRLQFWNDMGDPKRVRYKWEKNQ